MPTVTNIFKSDYKTAGHIVTKLLLTTACFWVPVVLFLKLADEVREKTPLYGDVGILEAIHRVSSPTLDKVAIAITTLGSAPIVITAVLIGCAVLARKRQWYAALFLLFTAGGTGAINYVLKLLFHRQRPALWDRLIVENDYSFPSGHAMITCALAICVILLCWKTRFRWIVVIFASLYFILVALSRLYLGVHFPSDIAAGWCVSLLWVLTVHTVLKKYDRQAANISQPEH